MSAAPARLVEVALPLPLLQTFTYAVPERTRHPVRAGSRVVVPVRGKRVIGICVGESDGRALGDKAAKPMLDVPDAEPALTPDLLAVCRWMSEYYVAPLYNRFIQAGADIRLDVAEEVWVLGTPEDLAAFEAGFPGGAASTR